MLNQSEVVFKAPAKVLIAGGYGVLEKHNYGLTLALKTYFYSITSIITSNQQVETLNICVSSPQIEGYWNYVFNLKQQTIDEKDKKVNCFVENAIKYALLYVLKFSKISQPIQLINIAILFDRGYLSEPQHLHYQLTQKFIKYEKESTKTGLGSSAGVTVAIIGGLCRTFDPTTNSRTINCLSQLAHLAAQKKIGSNFDISTAVYGTHLYKNILPNLVYNIIGSNQFGGLVEIDPEVGPIVNINKHLKSSTSLMVDMRKGSNTRVMVSGFLKHLNLKDEKTIKQFYSQSKAFVLRLFDLLCSVLDKFNLIRELKQINKQYRQFLQLYSQITTVEVEPPPFKPFLDEINQLEQVAYSICPGSGGYDAIYILAFTSQEDKGNLKDKISEIIRKHKFENDVKEVEIIWDRDFGVSPDEHQAILKALNKYLKYDQST